MSEPLQEKEVLQQQDQQQQQLHTEAPIQSQPANEIHPADEIDDYCSNVLDADTLMRLQAGAFRNLCQHLRDRSDTVSNMDLMTVSGFCRNCLAKWMVLEARRLVDEGVSSGTIASQQLNALGYDEAAQHVYGMHYGAWKERHGTAATPEQLDRYTASEALHAQHDTARLAVRGRKPTSHVTAVHETSPGIAITASTSTPKPPLASNVCCEDVEQVASSVSASAAVEIPPPAEERKQHASENVVSRTAMPAYTPPPIPDLATFQNAQFPVTAILTVSDRAFYGLYETGDLSGPAVAATVQAITGWNDLDFIAVTVPDDSAAIQAKIHTLADQGVDLILTTGGTGFSARDVTPEATADVVDCELTSLMAFCATVVAQNHQPLQTLSRGTCGILNQTVVANLPGNPASVKEILPVLLPLLLHAVSDLHNVTPEILHIG